MTTRNAIRAQTPKSRPTIQTNPSSSREHAPPSTAHGGYFDEPAKVGPVTPIEIALDAHANAVSQLHDALSVLGDRLERTVLPPAPAADNTATASPAFGASPVLHRLTSLHSGIESAAARVHNILARLEA